MPRANRYILGGRLYHVTHRCHNRAFLLKFQRDRDAYRAMLRARLTPLEVSLFGYCLTSNHVHLLLTAASKEVLAALMQSLAGDFAQAYNIRKKRSGAFWGDRYHATLVESDRHLWNCLRYIDLNMVRAGAVKHPRDWAWCGYHELVGLRTRYRLIDRARLLEAWGDGRDPDALAGSHAEAIDEACYLPGMGSMVWMEPSASKWSSVSLTLRRWVLPESWVS
jgi:putative transposase